MSYEAVGGKLKLKGVGDLPIKKKKKKKSKDKEREKQIERAVQEEDNQPTTSESPKKVKAPNMLEVLQAFKTPAERQKEERLRQKEEQLIKEKAKTSHKDKIKEFNNYLANLSEHYDIPKVGPG